MGKNRLYIVIVLILIVLAIMFFLNRKDGTIKRELRDFAIADTSKVTKIFMVNKLSESVLLEKAEDNIWYVNGKHIARKDAVDLILKTFKRVDVKSPVPKAQFDNVVKRLAATHIKVEVYTDNSDEAEKVVYIGGPTQDNYGTYMMLENSSTPFITHIPGFAGYLSSRFFLEEDLWRDQKIFNYRYDMIKSVQLNEIAEMKNSFKVTNLGENKFELLDVESGELINNFDTLKAKLYLSQYRKLSFERIAYELTPERIDSIVSTKAIHKIILTDENDKVSVIETYLRKNPRPSMPDVEVAIYDMERMYARINESDELVIIQYFVFDPLFMSKEYFILN